MIEFVPVALSLSAKQYICLATSSTVASLPSVLFFFTPSTFDSGN